MSWTLGSLFDGIGVFPLAAQNNGVIPIWASEIVPAAVSITQKHFPNMQHLGDITKLNGGKIPPADIISFGSPCQNFSTMGQREGINGEKSSLFFHAIRIIKEMRDTTNNQYPTFAIWENVPGAFLSNHGMDFRTVLESFSNTKIPMPATGWANAGMVCGGIPSVAWRVLDAQYWGWPRLQQRRKRIFALVDFKQERAAKILFSPANMHKNFDVCNPNTMPAATGNRIFATKAGGAIPFVYALNLRCIRQGAKEKNKRTFQRGFGRANLPFGTLTTRDYGLFAFWQGDYKDGYIRNLMPVEEERLLGLPDGYTEFNAQGDKISDNMRYKMLGNSIALPCAEYILSGIVAISK